MNWSFRGGHLVLGPRPLVMGIVNVTPDSFSDGGRFADTDAAIEHGLRLVAEGADILDIGGESSRPGAEPVPLDEELARVVPVVAAWPARIDVPISVDTTKAEVARQAPRGRGARSSTTSPPACGDPDMVGASSATPGPGSCSCTCRAPRRRCSRTRPTRTWSREVRDFLADRVRTLGRGRHPGRAHRHRPGDRLRQDARAQPGLLLANLDALSPTRPPGLARRLAQGVPRAPDRPAGRPTALPASLAAACFCVARGTAHVLRVHDVGRDGATRSRSRTRSIARSHELPACGPGTTSSAACG